MYKSYFVPGRPGTEEFVPGHLLLPLSRDKGTPGQGKCPCPGTKGQRDVPSRGKPSITQVLIVLGMYNFEQNVDGWFWNQTFPNFGPTQA